MADMTTVPERRDSDFYLLYSVLLVWLKAGRKSQFSNNKMLPIVQNKLGMNIMGQGGKIMLFALPWLIVAIVVHVNYPQVASLPESIRVIKPVGYVLLLLGFALWGTAVFQLLKGFPKGELVTSGAYGIVRNPIYSSATFFFLPAATLLTGTWVYLVVSIFLYLGVQLFIGTEEKQLKASFGEEYKQYMVKVNRMVPFMRGESRSSEIVN